MAGFGIGYDNLDDAAMAASYQLERQPGVKAGGPTEPLEYVSIIYRDPQDGKIYRTGFNRGSAGQASITPLLQQLQESGGKALAVIHNHPGGKNAAFNPTFLSASDTSIGKGEAKGQTTGPLAMYLYAQDALRQGTGKTATAATYDPTNRQLVHQNFQTTAPTLAQVPIQEVVQRINQSNAFARAAALVRSQNPMLAATEK